MATGYETCPMAVRPALNCLRNAGDATTLGSSDFGPVSRMSWGTTRSTSSREDRGHSAPAADALAADRAAGPGFRREVRARSGPATRSAPREGRLRRAPALYVGICPARVARSRAVGVDRARQPDAGVAAPRSCGTRSSDAASR